MSSTGKGTTRDGGGGPGSRVIAERNGASLEITLNRPEKLNAFTPGMIDSLKDAFAMASTDDAIRAVLLIGAGRGFCAGQDLDRRDPNAPDWPPDLAASVAEVHAPLIRQIVDLPKPVVCAVNGVAAGAGANLALACDIVIASDQARFIQSFARIGLIPDLGGAWILPRLIGLARARAICLTGEPIDAETAAAWGMIWRAVPSEQLKAAARDIVGHLSRGPTVALGLTKSILATSFDTSLPNHFSREADYQRRAGNSIDYAEGVRAFFEKRPAKFVGY